MTWEEDQLQWLLMSNVIKHEQEYAGRSIQANVVDCTGGWMVPQILPRCDFNPVTNYP
jgi:hypothetical protein